MTDYRETCRVVYTPDPTPEEIADVVQVLAEQLSRCSDTGARARAVRIKRYLRVIAHLCDSNGVLLPGVEFERRAKPKPEKPVACTNVIPMKPRS